MSTLHEEIQGKLNKYSDYTSLPRGAFFVLNVEHTKGGSLRNPFTGGSLKEIAITTVWIVKISKDSWRIFDDFQSAQNCCVIRGFESKPSNNRPKTLQL